ncbi:MAG TPA: histidine kinase dimerization/phosphoacceptor domain -containing protein, partial [Methanotrichaceae archaeon]|nr:histidine kinase dimerization/phosphoacceptor domain -containing protein [Methanotrichaceae archaeon]
VWGYHQDRLRGIAIPECYKSRWTRKDGSIIWLEVNACLIKYLGKAAVQLMFKKIAEHNGTKEDLQKKDLLLESVASITTSLVMEEDLHYAIRQSLEAIGRAMDVDQAYVFENRDSIEGERLASLIYEWSRAGTETKTDNPSFLNLLYDRFFPEAYEMMSAGQSVDRVIQKVPAPQRIIIGNCSDISMLMVPVIIKGGFWGFIGFEDQRSMRIWSDCDESILQVCANSIGAAIIRERAEAALKVVENRYRILVEHIPAATYIASLDIASSDLYVSPQIGTILGYSQAEWIADPEIWSKLLHPADREKVLGENAYSFATGKPFRSEYRMIRRDGEVVWIEDYAEPTESGAGEPVSFYGVMLDITERKHADEMIAASLQEKEVLLREVHHRVKNNLQVTSSLLSLESRYITDKQALVAFKDCRNRIRSMALVHEKLHMRTNPSKVNFAEYTRDLIKQLLTSYGVLGGAVRCRLDLEDLLLDIEKAIPCGLIINELFTNCIKYAFDGSKCGEINISLKAVDGTVKLTISDNGKGLPQNIDVKNSKSLGLILVHSLVKQLRGRIDISTDMGTRFSLTFDA